MIMRYEVPFDAGVKKFLMENCPDELEDLDVLEYLCATCCLEEATLCCYLDGKEEGCLL
jgi:hypothetical protein